MCGVEARSSKSIDLHNFDVKPLCRGEIHVACCDDRDLLRI